MSVCRMRRLQRIVAIFCMAITCLFAVQTVIVGVDRVEHALGIDHHATDVAGTLMACDEDRARCGSTGESNLSHGHFGDTASSFLVTAPDAQLAVLVASTAVCLGPASPIAETDGFRLERPPKA